MRLLYNRIWVLLVALSYAVPGWSQQPNDHIFPAAVAARAFINFYNRGFLVNGKRTFLVSAGLGNAGTSTGVWGGPVARPVACRAYFTLGITLFELSLAPA